MSYFGALHTSAVESQEPMRVFLNGMGVFLKNRDTERVYSVFKKIGALEFLHLVCLALHKLRVYPLVFVMP